MFSIFSEEFSKKQSHTNTHCIYQLIINPFSNPIFIGLPTIARNPTACVKKVAPALGNISESSVSHQRLQALFVTLTLIKIEYWDPASGAGNIGYRNK